MKTISLKLDEDLCDRLDRAAKEMSTSKSSIVREALKEHMKTRPQAAHGSCLRLFGKVIGCIEGPADLSFNEAHMKDFGR